MSFSLSKVLVPGTAVLTATALLMAADLKADARVTVAHFAPFSDDIDATSVSVAVDGDMVLENVKF